MTGRYRRVAALICFVCCVLCSTLSVTAAVADRLLILFHRSSRPVKMRSFIIFRIQIQIFLRRIEGFMGIKRFQLQQPVVRILILLDELTPPVKALGLRKIFLFPDILPVHPVVAPQTGFSGTRLFLRHFHHGRDLRALNLPLPVISLLPPDDLPG